MSIAAGTRPYVFRHYARGRKHVVQRFCFRSLDISGMNCELRKAKRKEADKSRHNYSVLLGLWSAGCFSPVDNGQTAT